MSPTVVRILVHPAFDPGQPCAQRSSIKEVTARVTEMPGSVVTVDLSGEEADPSVEL